MKPLNIKTTFVFAGRLATVFAIVWLGVSTTKSVRTLFASPVERVELPTIDTNLNLMPVAGSWSFADSPVQISSTNQADYQFPGALVVDQPAFKAAIERDADSEPTAATIAMRNGEAWQVLKLDAEGKPETAPHLLPLDPSAKRICGRWANDQLLMEFVSVNARRKELLDQWKQDGWEIRHTAWGDAHSFSFLCVKDGNVVYAWSQNPHQIQSLLLSSSPDVRLSRDKGNNS